MENGNNKSHKIKVDKNLENVQRPHQTYVVDLFISKFSEDLGHQSHNVAVT